MSSSIQTAYFPREFRLNPPDYYSIVQLLTPAVSITGAGDLYWKPDNKVIPHPGVLTNPKCITGIVKEFHGRYSRPKRFL